MHVLKSYKAQTSSLIKFKQWKLVKSTAPTETTLNNVKSLKAMEKFNN